MCRRLLTYITMRRLLAEDFDHTDRPLALYQRAAGALIAGRDVWTDSLLVADVLRIYLQDRYGHSSHVVRHGAGWRITLDR